ncbi:MAG: histidine phosphatase family protein [Anaerolineaceae bacterium]|nr:histidine phosphatase family protein [Anaerolineaceae bacterium]MCB9101415.1 histidine phosphatase family protein [Anaerolineales bacterium]
MKLYIIRHAQSTNNALANQMDRVNDPSLTDLGRQQSQILAEHLATGVDPEYVIGVSEEDTEADSRQGYKIDHLYCSAMYRSLLTAQAIGQMLGLTPEVWLDIHEHGGIFLDHGSEKGVVGYPGKTRSEILAEFPTYKLPPTITEEGWWNPALGKEDWPACHGRAIRVYRTLRERAATRENIAIVTHGGFMDALMKAIISHLPSSTIFYHHYNTAITRIDFRPDGGADIRYINRFDHLPAALIS